jgi:hypothetical protein
MRYSLRTNVSNGEPSAFESLLAKRTSNDCPEAGERNWTFFTIFAKTMEPQPREQRVEAWHSVLHLKKRLFFQTVLSGKLN